MREIKFRAWDKLTKMIYINDDLRLIFFSDGTWAIVDSTNTTWTSNGGHEGILMQYIGQDNNGKEIYEGDVLKIWMDGDLQDKFYIVESVEKFYFDCNREDRYLRITKTEVVGNIYENPELLEEI